MVAAGKATGPEVRCLSHPRPSSPAPSHPPRPSPARPRRLGGSFAGRGGPESHGTFGAMPLGALNVGVFWVPKPQKTASGRPTGRPASLARTAAGRPVRSGHLRSRSGGPDPGPGHHRRRKRRSPFADTAVPATGLKPGVWNHGVYGVADAWLGRRRRRPGLPAPAVHDAPRVLTVELLSGLGIGNPTLSRQLGQNRLLDGSVPL